MTTLPDDYARCQGKGLGGGASPECLNCLRRTALMRDHVLYSYMAPPEFTTTCPERIAP
jgi:hypothetical protein